MADVMLRPGQNNLADWRAIYRGAGVTLDPAAHAAVVAGARAVEAILARGEPVYGINTGFGKLASVRIEPADSRHCSATSCCRMPPASASPCRHRLCG